MPDDKKAKAISGWIDCKYQPGKCMTGIGWVCQLNELSEEEKRTFSERCTYLLRDRTEARQLRLDSEGAEATPISLLPLKDEEKLRENG